jgi:hypothetical protein
MRIFYCRREVTTDPEALAAFTDKKLTRRRMKDVVGYSTPLFTEEVHRWRWNGQKPTAKNTDHFWWIDGEEVRLEWPEPRNLSALTRWRKEHRRGGRRRNAE